MIGLPGDHREKTIETVKRVIEMKPDISRIYPTLVIKDTVLEEMYKSGLYSALPLKEAIDLSKEMYHLLFSNGIKVIRMGLQPTKNILEGEDVVAGPFHSSFRSLVISDYIYDLIVESLDDYKGKKIVFKVNNKDISYLIGDKRINKNRLIKKYNLETFKIESSNQIERGRIIIKFEDEIKEIRFS